MNTIIPAFFMSIFIINKEMLKLFIILNISHISFQIFKISLQIFFYLFFKTTTILLSKTFHICNTHLPTLMVSIIQMTQILKIFIFFFTAKILFISNLRLCILFIMRCLLFDCTLI